MRVKGKSVKLHADLSHEQFGPPLSNIGPDLLALAPGYVSKTRGRCRRSTLSILAFVESIRVTFLLSRFIKPVVFLYRDPRLQHFFDIKFQRFWNNPNIDSTWGKAKVADVNISPAFTPGRGIKTAEAPVRRLEGVCFLLTERRCRSVSPQSKTGWGTRRWGVETPPHQTPPLRQPPALLLLKAASATRRPDGSSRAAATPIVKHRENL